MAKESEIYQSKKSLLIEAYNEYKISQRIVYEDDFFVYDHDEVEFSKKLLDAEKKLRIIASVPVVVAAVILAYFGLRA